MHQERPLRRQALFFAWLRPEIGQFLHRMAQKFGLAGAGRSSTTQRLFCRARLIERRIGGRRFAHALFQSAEKIEQAAMRRRIEEPAIIRLTMNFDQHAAQVAHERHTHCFIIDESARAAVRRQHAAQDDLAFALDAVFFRKQDRRMTARQIEDGDGRALGRIAAHARSRPGARTRRHAQRIEKNGFAGARFARQHVEAGRKVERHVFDQHNVANLQRREHRTQSGLANARLIQEPLFTAGFMLWVTRSSYRSLYHMLPG